MIEKKLRRHFSNDYLVILRGWVFLLVTFKTSVRWICLKRIQTCLNSDHACKRMAHHHLQCHWLSQYPTNFGEWNEDTFIPKHSSGGLWKCLSTVREASGVTRYGKLGWHWRPRRVPNQSCYGYHQISHEGDAMEIFVIAPYASG